MLQVVPLPVPHCVAAVRIGRLASLALFLELACYPKPGLVSFVDNGAHRDMDAQTLLASIDALSGYFPEIAEAGADHAPLAELRDLGRAAEIRMLTATQGVNTHRGAIFAIGLLCAAAGRRMAIGTAPDPVDIACDVGQLWGATLGTDRSAAPITHGQKVRHRYGANGARGEAAAGFPTIRRAVLPRLETFRRHPRAAASDALFASLAVLEDTNLLHRGGTEGLSFVRQEARQVLRLGGVRTGPGHRRAVALHKECIRRNLSPGGTADMLSAGLFLKLLAT